MTERAAHATHFLRFLVAGLIFIHGVARISAGAVVPFGGWLEGQGFPFGIVWAWAVTIFEIVAPLLIASRRFVSLLCLGHAGIIGLGLILVHLPHGWFVVGLGRNGVEYSVALLGLLLSVAYVNWPQAKRRSDGSQTEL